MLIYLQMIESFEDKTKFEQLYIKYRGLMFHVAMRILNNEQDAEDAVHCAFLAIIENIEKISDPQCPKTRAFVVIIVERKAIDLLRAKSKMVSISFDEAVTGVEIPLPGDNGLADAMAGLPVRYRQALLLRYELGYNTKEIAEILDMKRDSAQKLLWRAKESLRSAMEKEAGKNANG